MKLNDNGNDVVGKKIELNCDCLAISGGWTPMVHLFTQSGGKLKFDNKDNIFVPDKTNLNQLSIGSAKGDFELDDVLKNSINDTKNFLNIENSNFDKIDVRCSKEKEKKTFPLNPIKKILRFIDNGK